MIKETYTNEVTDQLMALTIAKFYYEQFIVANQQRHNKCKLIKGEHVYVYCTLAATGSASGGKAKISSSSSDSSS